MTPLTTTTVKGQLVEPGCWVAGHWGQYALDRLAEIAEIFGWQPDTWMDDPRALRKRAELFDADNAEHNYWDLYHDSDEPILEWLNTHTDDQFVWHWWEGELYLSHRNELDELYP